MTFLSSSSHGVLSLVNNNGYQLTSLTRYHDNYTASYPANGEMMLLYNESNSYYYHDPVNFVVEWECDEDTPVVPPAEGYNSSDYLTLAQTGTYKRQFSEARVYNWIIPCTGTLSIAEQVGNVESSTSLTYFHSNGSTVLQEYNSSSNEYEVRGDFLIQLSTSYNADRDNFIVLSWSCNGVRPVLTPAPATRAPVPTPLPATPTPPTYSPLPACEQTSSPLNAAFTPPNTDTYKKCWTFQCKGTVHMTFLSSSSHGVLSLVNSNGYQLTSLTRYHDNYTASYPANGEMMILYNESNSYYYHDPVNFVVEWECDEDTPVVPPAVGYGSSDYLTLAQTGTYKRQFSEAREYNWIIPCTGTLSIAEQVGNVESSTSLTYFHSNGVTVLQEYNSSSNEYEVRGDFLIQLSTSYNADRDNFIVLSWSCNGVRPVLTPAPATRAPVPTPLPATPTPPTYSPLPPCEQTSSPLNAAFTPPNRDTYKKCWTFQCKGTVHMTFLSSSSHGVLSLVNSNGYQLTSLTRYHDNYTASYPANGEMIILYNESNSYYYHDPVNFTVKWECDEDTPVVPPAEGYDSSDYLTLAQSGTYKRQFSEAREYNWIIPCTGTLSIAEQLGDTVVTVLTYNNSNGSTVLQRSGRSSSSSNEYEVRGDFLIQLSGSYNEHRDNFFVLSWSCVCAVGEKGTGDSDWCLHYLLGHWHPRAGYGGCEHNNAC